MVAKIFERVGALRIIKLSLAVIQHVVIRDCVYSASAVITRIQASHCDEVIIVSIWMKSMRPKLRKIMALIRHIRLGFIFNQLLTYSHPTCFVYLIDWLVYWVG